MFLALTAALGGFALGWLYGPRLGEWLSTRVERWLWPAIVLALATPLSAQTLDTTVIRVPYLDSVRVPVYRDSVFTAYRDSLVITPRPGPPPDTVTPPPPPAGGTNEPAGFVRITSRSCDGLIEDGWTGPGNTAFAIVTEPDGNRVCQTTYRQGFGDGRAPATVERPLPGRPRQLYVRFRIKASANFVAHPVLTKGFHFWIGGRNRLFTGLNPQLTASQNVQGVTGYNGGLPGRPPFVAGTWHVQELVLTAGPTGRVTAWLDGRRFVDAAVDWGTSGGWEVVQWSPTYGGYNACGGNPCRVPVTMQLWLDDLYVSGR